MVNKYTFLRGIKSGINISWELAKVIIPVYFLVTFLKYTPVLGWISDMMSPLMKLVGLPGEASVPLVMGYFLNIYAAIGALLPLGLDVKQITIMAGMLLMAHSLPVETAVSKGTGVKVGGLVVLRLLLSFIMGVVLNLVM